MADKPIRILHVLGLFDYGGAESLVMNLFRHMDRSKIMFDFVVHSEEEGAFEEEAKQLGATIYRVPQYTGKNHFKYRNTWEKLFQKHREYTVIHGHVRSTANIYLKIAKGYGLKTIAHSHSISSGTGLSAMVKNVMQRGIRKKTDYFLACSEEAGRWLFGKKVVKQSNFYIMNNAIKAEQYIFNSDIRKKSRNKLGITNEIVIGHVGRLHESKNHLRLLSIYRDFLQLEPNSLMLLIGDGDLKEAIENKITELKLTDNVKMLGSRNDTHELLQAMDVFLFPSLYEGLGISVVEAQANSLPSLVSTVIPKEAYFTETVTSLPLEGKDSEWAKVLNQLSIQGRKVQVTFEDIKKAHYDISEISQWYAEFIEKLNSN